MIHHQTLGTCIAAVIKVDKDSVKRSFFSGDRKQKKQDRCRFKVSFAIGMSAIFLAVKRCKDIQKVVAFFNKLP